VFIDIEAGEESSSTEGIIKMEEIEYAESESSVLLPENEDGERMDLDVRFEEMKQDEGVEAKFPLSPTIQVGLEN
jgi:hypothetical protein